MQLRQESEPTEGQKVAISRQARFKPASIGVYPECDHDMEGLECGIEGGKIEEQSHPN